MTRPTCTRRDALRLLGVGAAAALLPGCAATGRRNPSGARHRPPNIIFVMSDDHAFQAIGCYGSRINATPNLDRLAREGVRFDSCFCTNSICAPSRAAILTGKYGHKNGIIDNETRFDGSQMTFPPLLRQAGYRTAVFGKWHLKSDPVGFDYWNILPEQGCYYNPDFIEMGRRCRREGYVTDLIMDDCLAWLRQHGSSSPFCVLVQNKAPHRPWMPGPDHLRLYEDVEIPVPDTLFDDYATRSDAARLAEMRIADHTHLAYDLKLTPDDNPADDTKEEAQDRGYWTAMLGRMNAEQRAAWDAVYEPRNAAFHAAKLSGEALVRWKYQRYIKDYLRCIASVDDNVGRLLKYLDESGLAENTLVIYTSDQGFYLGEHGWFDKRFMYEESLRMPLIVRYPREIAPGTVNESDIVLNVDFAPTFLELAGVNAPPEMQGRSLCPVLRGGTPADWRDAMYYHYFEYPAVHAVRRHYGIRTQRYKLMHFYYDVDAWEFYDLEKDPRELHNVYADPAYAAVVADLKARLQKLREQYDDTDETRYLPVEPIAVEHLAVGCPVALKHPFSPKYTGGGPNALTDGRRTELRLGSPLDRRVWQGFLGVDLDATIDLGSMQPISSISTGFLHQPDSRVFLPRQVEYAVSEDGVHFEPIATVSHDVPHREAAPQRREFTTKCRDTQARYIRVIGHSIGTSPEWHRSAGGRTWLFADEIVVK